MGQEGYRLEALKKQYGQTGNLCDSSELLTINQATTTLTVGTVIEAALPGLQRLPKVIKAAKRTDRVAEGRWTQEGAELVKQRSSSVTTAVVNGSTFSEIAERAAHYQNQAVRSMVQDAKPGERYVINWLVGDTSQAVWHVNLTDVAKGKQKDITDTSICWVIGACELTACLFCNRNPMSFPVSMLLYNSQRFFNWRVC